jgi:hypothetical protein
MRTCLLTVLACSIVAAAPTRAGMLFRQTLSSENEDGHPVRTVTELRIEGGKVRADFLEMTDNPFMKQGSYMLFENEDTAYIVNPKDRTYSRMDMGEMRNMQQMGAQMEEQNRRQGHSISVEDLRVDKKLEEHGPAMFGLPTQHVIYEVSYKRPMGLQSGPIKMTLQTRETYEIWATHALDARLGSAAFKRRGGVFGGSEGGGSLAQVQKALGSHGFALKSIDTSEGKTVTTIPLPFGNQRTRSKTTMEVTDLREASLKRDLFEIPKGYTEIEMANPNAGGMPDLNRIPGGGGQSRGPDGPSMPDLDKMTK